MGLPAPLSSRPQPIASAAISNISPAAAATVSHPLPSAHASAAHPRRPAPIQTTSLPSQQKPAQHPTDDRSNSPERPPVSPITPTDQTPSPAPPQALQPAPRPTSLDDSTTDSRPPSRKSFTFAVPSSAGLDWPSRPPSQRSTPQAPSRAAGSHSNSASPQRPQSSSSQPHQINAGAPQRPQQRAPPLATASAAAASGVPPATFMPRPQSEALDESSNTDVAALKACISVLQLQQAKSRRDIATLQRMKGAAVEDPAGFAEALQSGRLDDGAAAVANPLAATFAGVDDDDDDDSDEEEDETKQGGSGASPEDRFGKMPRPQNIVRCPPVNWSKYHIVGEPLDRMHEEQRRRPDPGEPWREAPRDAVVFAPYSPFKDHVGPQPSMVTRKGGKRPTG